MINFAHGEFFMFGTFGAFFVAEALSISGFLESNPLLSIIIMLIAAIPALAHGGDVVRTHCLPPAAPRTRAVPLITAISSPRFCTDGAAAFGVRRGKASPNAPALACSWLQPITLMQRSQIAVLPRQDLFCCCCG